MNQVLPDDKISSRTFFIKRFLLLLFLSVLLSGIGMVVLYDSESKAVQSEIESEAGNLAELHRKHVEGLTRHVIYDLTFLAAMAEEPGMITGQEPENTEKFLQLCLIFMREKPIYDQIRIINTLGKEILRVNLGPSGPQRVPAEQLQDKSNRYYVQAARGLPRGGIYISSLDLNIERGAIEVPPKAMIRFVKPVFSDNGQMLGMVVLNLLGNSLFHDMLATEIRHDVHAPVPMNTMMLDSRGYWVYNPLAPEKEFSFMYPDRKSMDMPDEFPQTWKALSQGTEGKYLGPEGLYVFTTVDASLGIKGTVTGPGHPWKIVVFTSTPSLAVIYGKLQKKFLIPYVVLGALLAIISWFLAESQTRTRFAEAQIAHLAHHDHLTGLANRLLFSDLADLAISTAERNDRQLALLFLDLDRFKPINDLLGHQAGDEVLKEIAMRIQNCIRKPDIVARLGGDEFAVILQDIDAPSGALKVSRKLIDCVTVPLSIKGTEQRVGVSIGISIYPKNGTDIDTLLRLADNAMYRAKGSGGSRAELSS